MATDEKTADTAKRPDFFRDCASSEEQIRDILRRDNQVGKAAWPGGS